MAIDEYLTKYNEIVELCEDYWHLLRVESSLFTHFPKKMFARKSDQNALMNQISRGNMRANDQHIYFRHAGESLRLQNPKETLLGSSTDCNLRPQRPYQWKNGSSWGRRTRRGNLREPRTSNEVVRPSRLSYNRINQLNFNFTIIILKLKEDPWRLSYRFLYLFLQRPHFSEGNFSSIFLARRPISGRPSLSIYLWSFSIFLLMSFLGFRSFLSIFLFITPKSYIILLSSKSAVSDSICILIFSIR